MGFSVREWGQFRGWRANALLYTHLAQKRVLVRAKAMPAGVFNGATTVIFYNHCASFLLKARCWRFHSCLLMLI